VRTHPPAAGASSGGAPATRADEAGDLAHVRLVGPRPGEGDASNGASPRAPRPTSLAACVNLGIAAHTRPVTAASLAPPGKVVGAVMASDGEALVLENCDSTRSLWQLGPRESAGND
jgi:hypothetical protein